MSSQPGKPSPGRVGKVSLVGAGPGDPGLITVRGLERLRRAEVVVYDRLVSESLLSQAPAGAELIYVGKASSEHTLRQSEINALLVAKAQEGKRVVRLKGGDPFVFGRGGEEAEELVANGVPFEIVPGVTSAVAAPAYAGIPVTHRRCATALTIFTGHEDPAKGQSSLDWERLATNAATLVCLMGAENLSSVVGQLLGHGRPPETPAALVQWGTWPNQRTLASTLGEIVHLAAAKGFGPSAVLVVGEVVRLHDTLRWFDNRPLFGRRVLVTRAQEQASQLSHQLAEAGAQPVEVPAIKIEPPDSWQELDQAISRLQGYDWVVFTSANGVRSLFGRLESLGRDARAFGRCQLAAIGAATAEALHAVGLRADYVPDEYVAEALAAGLASRGMAGSRTLVARAAEAREALVALLRDQGALVDEVPAYRTAVVPGATGRLQQILEEGGLDAVTFASSSSVRSLVSALDDPSRDCLAGLTVACIGPITAQTARELGLRVDVIATQYTIRGLVEALERYYDQ